MRPADSAFTQALSCSGVGVSPLADGSVVGLGDGVGDSLCEDEATPGFSRRDGWQARPPAATWGRLVLVTSEREWVEFDAVVEPMPWGRSIYVIVRLEQTLAEAARTARTRRVEGTIDEVRVNVGVNRADVLPDAFMYAGKALQRRLGARPGDVVHCRLRPADPDDVPLPDDLHRALADAGRLGAFERRTPAERRRLLHPIEDAVRPETRQQRTTALLRSLPPD